jgi:predicted Zn-dependent peptidase
MKYLIILLFIFLSISGFSQQKNIELSSFELKNGFTVVIIKNPEISSITAELYFRAGSRYGQNNQFGFAYLMEHTLRPTKATNLIFIKF